MITDTSRSPYARLSAIPYKDVAWTGGLYKERFDTVAAVTARSSSRNPIAAARISTHVRL